jgi:hypothetical protein
MSGVAKDAIAALPLICTYCAGFRRHHRERAIHLLLLDTMEHTRLCNLSRELSLFRNS